MVISDPSPGWEQAEAIALDGTHLYVAGSDRNASNLKWRIEKRSVADGSLDLSFGFGGFVVSSPSASSDVVYDIAVDATHLYAAGLEGSPSSGAAWRVEKRSLSGGDLDPAFGNGGVVTSDPSPSWDGARGIALDGAYAYIVGYDNSLAPGDTQWRVEKRDLVDGVLDPTFGIGGVAGGNPSTGGDMPWGIVVGPSYLYITGTAETLNDRTAWRLEKRCK